MTRFTHRHRRSVTRRCDMSTRRYTEVAKPDGTPEAWQGDRIECAGCGRFLKPRKDAFGQRVLIPFHYKPAAPK